MNKNNFNYSRSYCFNPSLETFCGWESKFLFYIRRYWWRKLIIYWKMPIELLPIPNHTILSFSLNWLLEQFWRNICTQSREKLIWSLPCEVWTRNRSHNAKNLHWFRVFQRCRPSWIIFRWTELLGSLKSLDLSQNSRLFCRLLWALSNGGVIMLVDFRSLSC